MKANTRDLVLPTPDDLKDAEELLIAYGRWAHDRYRKQHCASAEGRYRAPPNDDDREPKAYIPPDFKAMEVQRALQAVPDLQRAILHIIYVPKRLPPEAQLRILHIPPRLCQDRHRTGLRMFWNIYRMTVLQRPENRGTVRAIT